MCGALLLLWWWLPQLMDKVWGEGDQVQVIHPAAACIAGRPLVSKGTCLSITTIRGATCLVSTTLFVPKDS